MSALDPRVRGRLPVSIVIPTFNRDRVLIDTVTSLLQLPAPAAEIILVDQSSRHDEATRTQLEAWNASHSIRWIVRPEPSIPAAMNAGLVAAANDLVLFLDDDIAPDSGLVEAHFRAHQRENAWLVAGRVLQPWHVDGSTPLTGFAGTDAREIEEFMGGNFSINRQRALALGGFDENFVRVAYRFEAEFAARLRAAGGTIRFEPGASLRHLKAAAGGTRTFGEHLRTVSPAHAVGEYYYLLRAKPRGWLARFLKRPLTAIGTRHHLRRPWWILPSLLAEILGMAWATAMHWWGPKLLEKRA